MVIYKDNNMLLQQEHQRRHHHQHQHQTEKDLLQSTSGNMTSRRRRGAIGSLLLLAFGSSCGVGMGVAAAFSSPDSAIMKVGNRYLFSSSSSASYSSSRRNNKSNNHNMNRQNNNNNNKSLRNKRGIPTSNLGTAVGKWSSSSSLEMICQDQHEFELSVGHAMDVLRRDYPHILTHNPDYSIYDPKLELIDPSGVQLHGLKNYKASFQLLHAIVAIFYCPERSGLTFRMCYDKARQNIRIHWNAQVIPKAIFGGYKTTLHADGISVYELSRQSGNITQHRIERLVINDASVMPEQGIFAALRGHAVKSNVDSIPVFNTDLSYTTATTSINAAVAASNGEVLGGSVGPLVDPLSLSSSSSSTSSSLTNPNQVMEFHNFRPFTRSVLFSEGHYHNQQQDHSSAAIAGSNANSSGGGGGIAAGTRSSEMSAAMDATSNSVEGFDWEAFEKKNLLRKKFGLDPLTPEEFMDLQEQVAELDNQQQQRAAAAAAAADMNQKQKEKKEEGNFFQKLMGNVLDNTCESNFDCESPEVCCDFGFKKMCCSSGMRVLDGPPRSRYGQWAEIPVIANPGPNYPPSDPRNNRRY